MEVLITACADPSLADSNGETALQKAGRWNRLAIDQALLLAGADPSKKDNQGRTPADVARDYGNSKITVMIDKFSSRHRI